MTQVTQMSERLLGLLPPWMNGPNARNYVGTIAGYYCDLLLETVTAATLARFIKHPACLDEARGLKGQERRLPKLPGETSDQYRDRVHKAWDAWHEAGSGTTIKNQLAILGLTAEIKQVHDWNFGTLPSWRYFWVVLRAHNIGTPPLWDDGADWDDGSVWDGTAQGAAQIQACREIIRQFKPAHMECHSIIVVYDTAAWDAITPPGNWEDPNNRPPASTAIFWPGV